MLLRGTSEKYEYLGENETKNQTVLTHWSVAQAGSNDEKNRRSKISLDCPFKAWLIRFYEIIVYIVSFDIKYR